MDILIPIPHHLAGAVCSTALLRCLKKSRADAVLHVVAPATLAPFLSANPHIDHLITTHQLHTSVAAGKYAAMIDLPLLEENRRWAKDNGAAYFSAGGKNWWADLKKIWERGGARHAALQYVEAAAPLGVAYDGGGMELVLLPAQQVGQHDIPTAHSAGYVAFAFGDSLPLHSQVLETFCQQVRYPVIITGSRALYNEAQALTKWDGVKVYNACGKFSEVETADLLRRARVVVSAHEGWLQVAAAWGRPVVALQTPNQQRGLVPPLYAQRFLQGTTLPFTVLQVERNVATTATGSTPKAVESRSLFATHLASLVQELWAI